MMTDSTIINQIYETFIKTCSILQIIEFEHSSDNDVKSAFLFCCFSGLRFSDVKKMTWGEITVTNDGQAQDFDQEGWHPEKCDIPCCET